LMCSDKNLANLTGSNSSVDVSHHNDAAMLAAHELLELSIEDIMLPFILLSERIEAFLKTLQNTPRFMANSNENRRSLRKTFLDDLKTLTLPATIVKMFNEPIVFLADVSVLSSHKLTRKVKRSRMIFFPECFDFITLNPEESTKLATEGSDSLMHYFSSLAKEYAIWISLGGFHNKDPTEPKPWNSHMIIDSGGEARALYNKLHLFDLEIPGKFKFIESDFTRRGIKMVPPVNTPIGKLGLSICNDLRFSELALWNRYKGAEILSYPSAFTLHTGLAHFEPLLRSRAIETQCYVVAANQTGKLNEELSFYGHAMVIDPWGAVIAQCSEGVGMCFAEIDLAYVAKLRKMQPLLASRRSDLYMLHVNEEDEVLRRVGRSNDIVRRATMKAIRLNDCHMEAQPQFAKSNLEQYNNLTKQ
ncbi:hydrolase, carbon-nitrogen family, partial [Teladorsagia circumcincta]